MSDRDAGDDPSAGDMYLTCMDNLVDQAIDYMGRDRAVTIANSAPVEVDEDGDIQEFQLGETEASKRAVTQLVLEAYVQVVGRQLVINMLQVSVPDQHLQTLEDLCPADSPAPNRAMAT